jgi:hypothetical protein
MTDLMTGSKKPPVLEKKVVVKAPPPPRDIRPLAYEIETIAGGKRSVDKFE